MPNELQKKGAAPAKPTRYGILWTNRMATGIWTQRSPLRDAASSRIEEEFYGARGDAFIGGLNTEISPKLTLIRRPGQSVYNTQTFPAITRFYENRTILYNQKQTAANESIQVIADTASVVYDATGPSTKTAIFNKTSGAGSTYFQSVGNSLYFSDGPDQQKYLSPSLQWASVTQFSNGQWIVDTNGNIQEVYPTSAVGNIVDIQITHQLINPRNIVTITLTAPFPITSPVPVTLAGMTTVPSYNGSQNLVQVNGNQIVFYAFTGTGLATTPETGTVTYGTVSPSTGGTQPAWNVTPGGLTTDGGVVWQNMGSRTENWQIAAPTFAPGIAPATGNVYWAPNANFALYTTIIDSNGNLEIVLGLPTNPALSGSISPVWSTTQGTPTPDGQLTWINYGKAYAWQANYDVLNYSTTSTACILDTNGNIQRISSITTGALTGATQPVWSSTLGTLTTDNDVVWQCCGPGTVISTGAYQWAYSYHGLDGSVTTASPIGQINTGILGTSAGLSITVSGPGTTDPQCDQIWIWRTVQGGSQLFFDTAIPNPGAGTTNAMSWFYTDTLPDVSNNGGPSLNELIEAPIDSESNPPPVGITALAYHLGRVWGAVGNSVYYSQGPDVASGNGNTAWSVSNVFVFPSSVSRLFPTASGLLVFTTSDIYIIQGLGTSSSAFFSAPFLQNIGLISYDSFTVNGSIVYLYTSDNQVITLDPASGVSEIGFPIGDQFGPQYGTETFTPTSTHCTWHIAGSQDKGLYVSDFTGNWWRMTPTPSPETGFTWSPLATIVGGFSAVQSVETVPGTHTLLLGPQTSGPILKRDYSVYTDNGSKYPAYAILGSIVLAQPGQIALVESLTTDSVAVGTPIQLAVQLDEIAPLSAGYFEPLIIFEDDPPVLSPSMSVYAQRFYVSNTQDPAVCRHLQIQINFGTDTVKNELLSLSLFGGFEQSK